MTDKYKNIEELIEGFFEGKTSKQEEEILYDYFTSGQYSEHLAKYAPIFDCLKNDLHLLPRQNENTKPTFRRNLKRFSYTAAIAASVLIAVILIPFSSSKSDLNPFEGSYRIVDGKKITDMDILMPEIEKTLSLVGEIKGQEETLREDVLLQTQIYEYYLNLSE